MSEKTPGPNEWWFSADMKHRRFIIGLNSDRNIIWMQTSAQENSGSWVYQYALSEWHHEPACDSWTWEPDDKPKTRKVSIPEWLVEADELYIVAQKRKPQFGTVTQIGTREVEVPL